MMPKPAVTDDLTNLLKTEEDIDQLYNQFLQLYDEVHHRYNRFALKPSYDKITRHQRISSLQNVLRRYSRHEIKPHRFRTAKSRMERLKWDFIAVQNALS